MSVAGTVQDHVRDYHLARRRGETDAARLAATFAGIAWAKCAVGECPPEAVAEPFRLWFREGVDMVARWQERKRSLVAGTWSMRPGTTHAAHAVGRED